MNLTFWRLGHEVDRTRLGPEVLPGAVDPRVDALHLVGGLTQPHVPGWVIYDYLNLSNL